MSRYLRRLNNVGLPTSILLLSILSARLQLPLLGMLAILLMCLSVGLVGFGKWSKSYNWLLLWSIGLGMLYQTTLLSNYLVGTDIHTEYYYYSLSLNGWNPNIPHNYNSSLGLVVLAPWLTKLFYIDGVWVFKVIFPLVFSFTPVVLYFSFKHLLEPKLAFLSSFFFISMPVFFLEVVGIAKLQLGGLLLACLIWIVVSNKLKGIVRLAASLLVGVGIIVVYYTLGFWLVMSVVIGMFVLSLVKLLEWGRINLRLEGMVFISGVVIMVSLVYFGGVGGGEPLKTMAYYGYANILGINPNVQNKPMDAPNPTPIPIPVTPPTQSDSAPIESPVLPSNGYTPPPSAFQEMDKNSLIKAAIGLDFMEVSILGKLFRLLQLITGICIALGCIVLLRKRNEVPEGYLMLVGIALVTVLATLAKPGFFSLLNITRTYHILLYTLSPLLILGGLIIFRKAKWLSVGLIIPYFLLTSGFIFEAKGTDSISELDIPYSIGLSATSIDTNGLFVKEDEDARRWLLENTNGTDIYSDLHGMLFLYEVFEPGRRVFNFPQDWSPKPLSEIPKDSYIYLRKWNVDNKKVTYWANIGLRKSYTFNEVKLDKLLDRRQLVYDKGVQVWGPKSS